MRLLLDTMVASELRRARSGKADPVFAAWAEAAPLDQAFLSVITLHELEVGCLLTARKDPAQGLVYSRWLGTLAEAFDGRIVDVTREVASIAAAYHVPDPAPFADALIGAAAAALKAGIATRNVSYFARFGLAVVNPWDESTWSGGSAA
ncbi:MAG: PIN domain-containing protein [Bifidobacteriaceae bacterium]|jgi:predicted nucleic acid-binding protein|nr:PIN domain-containing protein [Bifidobacteriaceae bacterium]